MRMVPIRELIEELQAIQAKFGNTHCYISGLAWGSVALWAEFFAKSDSEMPTREWLLNAGFVENMSPAGFPYYSHVTTTPSGDMEVRVGLGSGCFDVCLLNRSPPPPNGNANDEVFETSVGLTDKVWKTKSDLRELFAALGLNLRENGKPSDPRPAKVASETWPRKGKR